MINADLFKEIFGIYATELWAKPEAEFLEWLNSEQEPKIEPKYCDRNICLSNEYNGIGCDECEVTKSHQEPKIGHWITTRTWEHDGELYCDRCGFTHDFIDNHTAQYNYCPNCGADMRGDRR